MKGCSVSNHLPAVWVFFLGIEEEKVWWSSGLVATRSARPEFVSRPGTSPQSGLRGGRSLCEYCTVYKYSKIIKLV